jgi:hypothetical protein
MLERRILSEQVAGNGSVATDYPKCIQSSLANKNLAQIYKTANGQYYVTIKNMGAFNGYQFYSAGRVMKPDKTMGNYTCGPSNYPLIDGVDIVANAWQQQKGNSVTNYEKGQQQKIATQSAALDTAGKFYQEHNHAINAALGIGLTLATGGIAGALISAGVGLMDAKQYWDEGHHTEAGVVAAFSLLPGASMVLSKIPGIKELGAKGMSALAQKLVTKAPLTELEQGVVTGIAENPGLVTQAVDDSVKQMATQGVSKVANKAAKTQLQKIAHHGIHAATEKGIEHATSDILSGEGEKYLEAIKGGVSAAIPAIGAGQAIKNVASRLTR